MREEAYEDYCARVEQEGMVEFLDHNAIHRNVKYVYFTSKSKGMRNGKQRLRRNWKEIELFKYRDGNYHQAHHFPFDVYATEVLGDIDNAEAKFKELIPVLAKRG